MLAAFVFERATDLLTLLLFASLAVRDLHLFGLLAALVLGACAAIAWFAHRPRLLGAVVGRLRAQGWRRASRWLRVLQRGLAGCRAWANAADFGVSLLLGIAAWGATTAAFVWLLGQLGLSLDWQAAVALYPTAMLAGAASMVPGGIGTTEAAIVVLLLTQGAAFAPAALAAVAIRLSGLWFSIACGLAAASALEARAARRPTPAA